ncbi:MAG: ribonuclease H-like domain-containing protein [Dehalococcoidales bacterium]|nr:ribonuclease H-like domain-containing protein [Dehalococcoidales bacterium]
MLSTMEAYLDIESTGLYAGYDEITVIGVYLTRGIENKFVQLVGKDITADSIKSALKGASVLYTYNGSRFDLPFIRQRLDIDLNRLHTHCDLMYHCWRKNLYGGLKSVERQLGIERRLWEVDGYEAVRLWWKYVNNFDEDALKTLLAYNKEDVVNLKALKERLL